LRADGSEESSNPDMHVITRFGEGGVIFITVAGAVLMNQDKPHAILTIHGCGKLTTADLWKPGESL
jgi:hypothetical protein